MLNISYLRTTNCQWEEATRICSCIQDIGLIIIRGYVVTIMQDNVRSYRPAVGISGQGATMIHSQTILLEGYDDMQRESRFFFFKYEDISCQNFFKKG